MAAPDSKEDADEANGSGDLTDMLSELRVLLPTAQLLSAFLIALPFTQRFEVIAVAEKWIFLTTFTLSIASLVLLSAPAVQHRLIRPLIDRARFKTLASRQVVIGSVALAAALVSATQLVLSTVFGDVVGSIAAAVIAVLILLLWWWLPRRWKSTGEL